MTQYELFETEQESAFIESDECYTSAEIVELARACMGAIDCDPASCEEANRVVQATTYYSIKENGLIRPWIGNVWHNPPYSRGRIDAFVDKLIDELLIFGGSDQAITLVNSKTDTGWYHKLLRYCDVFCLPSGRLPFWGPGDKGFGPRNPQTIFYMPSVFPAPSMHERVEAVDRFVSRFSSLGQCIPMIDRSGTRLL